MNINFLPEDDDGDAEQPGYRFFLWVVLAGGVGSSVVFVGIVLYCRYKRLMLI